MTSLVRIDRSGLRQLLLLPTAIWVLSFFLIPLGWVVAYSFGEFDFLRLETRLGWSVENYRDLVDPIYLRTFGRSLVLSATTTLACLLLGFPIAYFISLQRGAWRRVLLLLVVVPFWASFIVRIYAVVGLLQDTGPVDDLARALGIIDGHLHFLYTRGSIAVGLVYSYVSAMILPIYVALRRIEQEVIDAAQDLGSTPARLFRRVTLPLSLPGVVVGCVIVGIPAIGEFVIPDILGGGKTLMLGNVLTREFLGGNMAFGAAISVALLLVTTALLVLARQISRATSA